MNEYKVSTRLNLLVGMLVVVMVAIAAMGLVGLKRTDDAMHSLYGDRMVPLGQLGEIESRMLNSRLAIRVALDAPSPATNAAGAEAVEGHVNEVNKVWAAYMATDLTAEEVGLAKHLADARTAFENEGLKPAAAALRANNADLAKQILFTKVRTLYGPVNEGIDALIKLQLKEGKSEFEASNVRYANTRNLALGALVVGVVLALMFGGILARSINRQLGAEPSEAANVAKAVASGDLSQHINLMPGDASSLMAQLKLMQESLSKVVSHVRNNSESVATASAEIAQGNQDLSQRTEEQASALEETAASMEQLGTTVKHNADNARQADALARSATEVAVQGGEVVGRVVSTMRGINESSRKISDIISVIDGIAFQTNILALNAAVEAARAGEQGRGFAVVASEVRSLAGRSADAAKEIKTLINDSVERVEQGTVLADQAGATMQEVVGSIKRVTDIMGEICTASVEQSAGVNQVGTAVGQMDQATQQNAALVEQSAAAAESLRQQAQELVQAVAVFRLGAH